MARAGLALIAVGFLLRLFDAPDPLRIAVLGLGVGLFVASAIQQIRAERKARHGAAPD
jgi:hypothetical protein